MIIVKVGGSVITDKTRSCTALPDEITRLTREIATSKDRMVIVHGAGSFGHYKADKYAEVLRSKIPSKVNPIVNEIHRDLLELSLQLLDGMGKADLHGVLLPGHAIANAMSGKVRAVGKIFNGFIRLGFTPVTNGDIILAGKRNFTVCSGDKLIVAIAREIKPERVIFITNVDGIIKDGKFAAELDVEDEIDEIEESKRKKDVTGDMQGKWDATRELTRMGVQSVFINGTVPGRVRSFFAGEDVPRTVVKLKRK